MKIKQPHEPQAIFDIQLQFKDIQSTNKSAELQELGQLARVLVHLPSNLDPQASLKIQRIRLITRKSAM